VKDFCGLHTELNYIHAQEREKRGDKWEPRFFRRTPEKETFSNEFSDEQCPLWEYNGEYMKLEPRAAMPEGADTTACTHLHACLHMCSQHETVLCCCTYCCNALLGSTRRHDLLAQAQLLVQ